MYASATQAIAAAEAAGVHRRRDADARREPVRLTDALIATLESLHLDGRKRVPPALQPSLDALNARLPAPYRRELRSGITIAHLLDQLFELQDDLLDHRVGTGRRRVIDLEGDDVLPTAS
ncbi:MAG TPA: hypothetical protein VNN74_07470 [Candidatus Micrarchaeia archaeon]|nr:hypothetical protein [Candidatus Micrarchaeia archaeon]